jgi:endonuclease III
MGEWERAGKILEILGANYPRDFKTALRHNSVFELLTATILSAQCTDEQVNRVTEKLFKKYNTPSDYAGISLSKLEDMIRSTGFYRTKARHIKESSKIILSQHDGIVPDTMGELLKLPGVARKTANIVLTLGYGISSGIAVDTHVRRLSNRMGLVHEKNPDKIEKELMRIIPKSRWSAINTLLVLHGRARCKARKPECHKCEIRQLCPKKGVNTLS